jgi:aspartyl-tRNA(Asn)/glutamyl-tRNA(Gln) amidotransferase subunit A
VEQALTRDLPLQSLTEISRLIKGKEISPVELTAAMLDRVDHLNSKLNCYITVLHDEAMRQAEALERLMLSGVWLGPMHGVPVALKDNIATSEVRTTAGSRILADWIPHTDATVAARLKAGGAILLGKLSMYEFAFGGWHPDYGETHNPWDISRCCAASSSGSACAVAASLAFGSMGTDTGGSVRIPAAVCGIYGFKPTYGLVSRAGVVPGSYNLDHVGPLGRTVRDVAVQLGVVAGFDDRDPASVYAPVTDYQGTLELGAKGVQIGVPKPQEGEIIDPEMRAAVEGALRTLEDEGAVLVEVELPNHLDARTVMWAISAAEVAEYHRPYVRTRRHEYSDDVGRRILVGEFLPATEYVHAQRVRQKIRAEYERVMAQVDVIALPIVPLPAWKIGEEIVKIDTLEENVMAAMTRYAPPSNLTGQPALTVPCGFNRLGLPLAFQIVGRLLDDAKVLRVGRAYERVTDWHRRRPPIA